LDVFGAKGQDGSGLVACRQYLADGTGQDQGRVKHAFEAELDAMVLAEGLDVLEAKHAGKHGVVAKFRMGIQGQMAGIQGHVGCQQFRQPGCAGLPVTGTGLPQNRPWCTNRTWAPASLARRMVSRLASTAKASLRKAPPERPT
jgi:hypothetical protein